MIVVVVDLCFRGYSNRARLGRAARHKASNARGTECNCMSGHAANTARRLPLLRSLVATLRRYPPGNLPASCASLATRSERSAWRAAVVVHMVRRGHLSPYAARIAMRCSWAAKPAEACKAGVHSYTDPNLNQRGLRTATVRTRAAVGLRSGLRMSCHGCSRSGGTSKAAPEAVG